MASRRTGLILVVVAVLLAVATGSLANAYLAGEAAKVNPPVRQVYAAARDVPAGTLLTAADLTTTPIALADDLASLFAVSDRGGQPPAGVAAVALKKGQPILGATVLPRDAVDSVAPLVPPTVTVGSQQQNVVGGLNFPLDRLVAPPPRVRVHDRIDVWGSLRTTGGASSTVPVLSNVEIIAFSGAPERPDGYVIAVTEGQLDRFLTFATQSAPMVLTVRPSATR